MLRSFVRAGRAKSSRSSARSISAIASEAHLTGRKWRTIINRDASAAKIEDAGDATKPRDEATALRRFRKMARAGWARDLLGD